MQHVPGKYIKSVGGHFANIGGSKLWIMPLDFISVTLHCHWSDFKTTTGHSQRPFANSPFVWLTLDNPWLSRVNQTNQTSSLWMRFDPEMRLLFWHLNLEHSPLHYTEVALFHDCQILDGANLVSEMMVWRPFQTRQWEDNGTVTSLNHDWIALLW